MCSLTVQILTARKVHLRNTLCLVTPNPVAHMMLLMSAEESEHEKNGLEEEVNNSEEYEDIFEMSGEGICSSPTNLSVDSINSLSYHDTQFNSDVEDQSSSSDTDHTTDLDTEPTSAPNDSDLSSLETESDVETMYVPDYRCMRDPQRPSLRRLMDIFTGFPVTLL